MGLIKTFIKHGKRLEPKANLAQKVVQHAKNLEPKAKLLQKVEKSSGRILRSARREY